MLLRFKRWNQYGKSAGRMGRLSVGTILGMAIVLALSSLSASAASAPVKLTFWHTWGGTQGKVIQWATDRFNNAHKGSIEVKAVTVDFWTFWDKFAVAMASGIGPDIVMMGDLGSANTRAAQGWIIPLDKYFQKLDWDARYLWPVAKQAAQYRGSTYAVPFNPDTRLFYYNKDHFAEAGLDDSVAPKTWNDLEKAAAKLTVKQRDGKYARLGFNPMWGNVWFHPWAFTNGGYWFDNEGNPTINSQANVEALEWVQKWYQTYGLQLIDDLAQRSGGENYFASGIVSMMVETNAFGHAFLDQLQKKVNYGVGLIPYNKGPASWGAGFDLEIAKKTPSYYDEAWQFVEYLLSEEVMTEWDQKTGELGARMDVAAKVFANDPVGRMAIAQMATSRYAPSILDCPNWWGIVWPKIDEACHLAKPASQALTEAQEGVEAELKAARTRNR